MSSIYRNVRLGATGSSAEAVVGSDIVLDTEQIRVLGCLVEKEATTPEYYPLTMNALISACNQKSSRDPVVSYDDDTVRRALSTLQEANLVHRITTSEGGRVPRYRHLFRETFALTTEHSAVLCVLMLRGAQTPGEIRQRSARLFAFDSLDAVEDAVHSLADRSTRPLIMRLARQAGTKEARYAHLLSGEIEDLAIEQDAPSAAPATPKLADRVKALEEQVAALRAEMDALSARQSG